MPRHILGPALVVASVSIIMTAAALINGREPRGVESSTRVITVDVGPSGQPGPIDIYVPNCSADPGHPYRHGPFRIVPNCYRDPPASPAGGSFPPCDAGRVTTDPFVVQASPFYAEDLYVPAGFTYAEPSASVCGSDVRGMEWSFPGSVGASRIQVARFREYSPTHGVQAPPHDSWVTSETGRIGGHPAVLLRAKPGECCPQSIYLGQGDIITVIIGDTASFDELVKLAMSLVD